MKRERPDRKSGRGGPKTGSKSNEGRDRPQSRRPSKGRSGGGRGRGGARGVQRRAGRGVGVRKGSVRLDEEGSWWVRAGHPWVYSKALIQGRGQNQETEKGRLMEILDPRGKFVGRGYLCSGSAVAMRVLSTVEVPRHPAGLVRNVVDSALQMRRRFLSPDITAYRLINGEGEGVSGITVDRYGQFGVILQYCEEAGFLVEEVSEVLGEAAGLKGIYLQRRFKPLSEKKRHEAASLVWGARADVEEVVHENGLRFSVDVRAPVSVGFFCDLREARARVAHLARGRSVVNCFCHTGSFSVYAAAAGASEVISVDLSRNYIAWTQKNFRLNGMDPAQYDFMAADATTALAQLEKRNRGPFGMVILDPPTYSAGKDGFVLKKDTPDLVEAALKVLEPGGFLLACCNAAKVSEDEFQKMIAAGAVKARRRLKILERVGLPADFPQVVGFREGAYLKAFLMVAD